MRLIPKHFTVQQRQFIEAVGDGGHLFLRATAGSGKTTTIKEAAWHVSNKKRPVAYFVYNRHSKESLGGGMPPYVRVTTVHGSGFGQLKKVRGGRLEIDAGKSLRLARLLYPSRLFQFQRKLAKFWDELREMVRPSDDWLRYRGVELGLSVDALFELAGRLKLASLADWHSGGKPDFTDQLWLPLQLGLGRGSIGTLFVDEAQDLTPLRQLYAAHVLGLDISSLAQDTATVDMGIVDTPVDIDVQPGQLILVGDTDQSIYQYSGADPCGMERLARQIGAREYPLSVSWRCPVSHIMFARHCTDFIEPASDASAGKVEHVQADTLSKTLKKGQVVLCRTNAPLIKLALELLAEQVSVDLRGRDMAKAFMDVLQEAYGADITLKAGTLQMRLEKILDGRLETLQRLQEKAEAKANATGSATASAKVNRYVGGDEDFFQCLYYLIHAASNGIAGVSLAALRTLITRLCAPGGDILLTTVHKAKGDEWLDVTILYPEQMPARFGQSDEERCVLFVALTRSKKVLRFAYSEAAWESGWRVRPFSVKRGSWRWFSDTLQMHLQLHEAEYDTFSYPPEPPVAEPPVADLLVADLPVTRLPETVLPEIGLSVSRAPAGDILPATLSAQDRARLAAAQQALIRRRTEAPHFASARVFWPDTPFAALSAFYGHDAGQDAVGQGSAGHSRPRQVYEVRQLMTSLTHCGRLNVQGWARDVLEALRLCSDKQLVYVNDPVYSTLRALARLGEAHRGLLQVIMPFSSGDFRLCAVTDVRRVGETVQVNCQRRELSFELYTGELSGCEFSLNAPCLHFSGLMYVLGQSA